MRKIILHTPWSIRSGLAHMALQLCKLFRELGHNPAIYPWRGQYEPWGTDDDSAVISSLDNHFEAGEIHVWLEVLPDISHLRDANFTSIFVCMGEYLQLSDAPRYRQFDHIVSPAEYSSQMLRDHFGIDHPQLVTIPWAVPVAPYVDRPARPVRFLTYARAMANDKSGIRPLVKAFLEADVDAELTVKVTPTQGSLRDVMPDVYRDCMDPRIQLYSQPLTEEQKVALYNSHHFYVCTARREGIGITTLESQSHGMPAIGIDAPPTNEWVRPGNGIIVPAVSKGMFRMVSEHVPDTIKLAGAFRMCSQWDHWAMGCAARATAQLRWRNWADRWGKLVI